MAQMSLFERHIAPVILDALDSSRVVFVSGARQVGKTTLVKQIAEQKDGIYYSLDDATTLNLASSDAGGFLANARRQPLVVIDEVQKAPGLLPAIKLIVDEDPTPGKFLLTGSTHLFSTRGVNESLAGRMERVAMYPLSRGEIIGQRETFVDTLLFEGMLFSNEPDLFPNEPDLFPNEPDITMAVPRKPSKRATTIRQKLAEIVATGGYPEPLRKVRRRGDWFSSYAEFVISHGLKDLSQILQQQQLSNMLTLLAHRSASLECLTEIFRELDIRDTTGRRYIALLEALQLYQPLRPWHRNIGKRLVKARKAHLIDSGLACALLGLDGRRLTTAEYGPQFGRLLESFMVGELRKQASWAKQRITLHHFRTHGGREVDLVLQNAGGKVVGIEVKASFNVTPADFKGLQALAEATGKNFAAGVVLYNGENRITFHERMVALPIAEVWK